ncbi:MAG: Na/Pi symporter [Acidimicrobiia bacterium]|nr:Na/Pi symporter [Acidimicrobiia bacterium]
MVGGETRASIPDWARIVVVLAVLYCFLAAIKSLEAGINAFGSDFTESLFERASNPLAGLFVGVLATVLVQSSSVTTAAIVGLVGSGALPVDVAVPMIMGANIGTTVTNTLASLGYLRRSKEFQLAFAGATMHDFFNLLAVSILLPVELATRVLSSTAETLAGWLRSGDTVGVAADSPLKAAIKAPVEFLESVLDRIGAADEVVGVVLLVVGLGVIFVSLAAITHHMRLVVADRFERSLNAVLAKGAGFSAMVIGVVMTVAVQSSSITTSVLVPLIAAGVVTLENAYPMTLGANVGTTITAVLASLAAERPEGLVIALTHTVFNLAGIALLYPVPALRRIPTNLARRVASLAEVRKSIVVVYVVGGFIVLPLVGVLVLQ